MFTNNVMFNGFGYGFHGYTEGGYIDNIDLIGNDIFNEGSISTNRGRSSGPRWGASKSLTTRY